MNYNKFFSETTKRRQGSILRELTKEIAFSDGDIFPLSGGIPLTEIFPFKEATFTTKDGTVLHLDKSDMDKAQQYGVTEGLEPLREIIRDFQVRLHNPPYSNWSIVMTSGAQEAIHLAFEVLINEGDYVIGGDHCFSGTLDIFRPLGAKYLAIEQDKHGMIPSSLRRALKEFDPALLCRLKILYIVPNGGNPEAYTLLESRRKEIYEIACEYDLIIIEDDPYQFIVFDQPKLPCSFLSLDTEGRVVRADSFSKTISPGIRLGYITAPRPINEKNVFKIQVSSQQASCLSQMVIYKLLLHWGFDGYMNNCKRICGEFKKQKDVASKYAEKWLKGLATWNESSGGMFLWIKVTGVQDTFEIAQLARNKKAFFAPGRAFRFDHSSSPYIRVSFSNATAKLFDGGFKILAESIQEFLAKHHGNDVKTSGSTALNGTKIGNESNGLIKSKGCQKTDCSRASKTNGKLDSNGNVSSSALCS